MQIISKAIFLLLFLVLANAVVIKEKWHSRQRDHKKGIGKWGDWLPETWAAGERRVEREGKREGEGEQTEKEKEKDARCAGSL